MRKLIAASAALFLAMLGLTLVATAAQATPGQGEGHTPVNVCHATSSDTNPYVFITVDDDSTKFQGHLMHRNEPNKTWKSDGVWNGVFHSAGDPKPDLIGDYTDSEGVLHTYDGVINEETGCGSSTPKPEPVEDIDRDVEQRMSCEAGLEERVTTTTTITDWVWVEGEWQLGEPDVTVTVGDWTFVRDLTKQEQEELGCNPVEPPCEEDDPCWNCETDGNKDCGPDKPDPKPEPKPEPKPDTPKADKPELPHTGAGTAALLALIGTALISSGTWLVRRAS